MNGGTSMAVSGGHGLGEAQDSGINWNQLVTTGIQTITSIYSAEEAKKEAERKREFDLQMAKIMANAAQNSAGADTSDGRTTQGDMILGMSQNTAILVGAGLAVAAVGGYFLLKKKRRR